MSNGNSAQKVAAHLLSVIEAGSPGQRLPSARDLMRQLQVGPGTVQQALDQLVAAGRIETRPGAGSFIASGSRHVSSDTAWQDVALGPCRVDAGALTVTLEGDVPGALQMGAGYLDEALRADGRLAQAMARAARRPGVWGCPPLRGIAELRTWFAGQLGADADDVLVTPAGQGALSAVIRAIVPAGESLLVATPGYPGALSIARSASIVPVAVPTDEYGVRPELAERAFVQSGARAMYLQPSFANPDGSVLAAERRTELLELAHRLGVILIEDDYARWLGHGDGVPAPLLTEDRHGHVVTIVSLSKIAAPSLRVGAVLARGPVAGRIAELRQVDDFYVSAPMQHAAAELVSAPSWKTHLRQVAGALATRRSALAAALHDALPAGCAFTVPNGGFSFWLRLPAGVDDRDVTREAALRKLFVVPGRNYVLTPGERDHLRLTFASLPEHQAPVAATRLAEAITAA